MGHDAIVHHPTSALFDISMFSQDIGRDDDMGR